MGAVLTEAQLLEIMESDGLDMSQVRRKSKLRGRVLILAGRDSND